MGVRGRAVVLGAGLQGVCAALGLRRQGYRVTLVDQDGGPLRRASLRNEGKIHLGFVYANDPTLRTSRLMLESALSFAPLVEGWLGAGVDWDALKSRPFTYCVAADSLVGGPELLRHYAALETHYQTLRAEPGLNYLGSRPRQLWRPLEPGTAVPHLGRGYATPLIETEEVALDLARFCALLAGALGDRDGLTPLYGRRVCGVERTARGFRVSGAGPDGPWRLEADLVVNCLWENRLAVDQTLGIAPRRPWVHRLKYRLLGQLPPELADLPALTFVLGPYGDIVTYPGGLTYLSFYPECMRGWSEDLAPPPGWEAACRGEPEPGLAGDLSKRVLECLERAVPGIGHSRVHQVDAGAIFTWGSSDIHDPDSELHQRHDTGVQAHDGYFSMDTGKLTSAPLFAERLLAHTA